MGATTNPAARLIAVLVAVREGKTEERMVEAWAMALGVEDITQWRLRVA